MRKERHLACTFVRPLGAPLLASTEIFRSLRLKKRQVTVQTLCIKHYTTGNDILSNVCTRRGESICIIFPSAPPHPHTKSKQLKQKHQHANSHTTANPVRAL